MNAFGHTVNQVGFPFRSHDILRDRHAAFDDAKAQGYAGFPALLLDDDRVILDESKLKEIF